MSTFVTATRSCVILAIVTCIRVAPANAQARGLVVEPADSLEVPAGAELFHISGTINNNQPVSASDPQFSAQVCDALRTPQPPESLGEVRSQLTSYGKFMGTHVGEASIRAQACAFAPPPTIVALLTITAEDGDILTLSVRAGQVAGSPPPPDSEALGGGSVTGGTGRFAEASGQFNLSAKSHGEVLPGTNVSTQRDIDIRGYIYLRAKNQR
jgi:hypothetical protein